jgi:hypothetical protein
MTEHQIVDVDDRLLGSLQARSPRKDRRGRNVMRLRLWMSAIAVVLASGVAVAQMQVVALMPDQVTWGSAPGLPADWQIAVLMGDPAKAGPYVQRVRLPPNAMIPPHTHPDDENITVLSGAFGIGEGEVADQAKGRVAIVQIHGIGPSGIKMIH